MTAQFTPGPWAIVGQEDHSDVERADDCVMITGCADAQGLVEVALVYTIDSFAPDGWSVEERPARTAECDANARLIAAAPDLYRTLDNVLAANDAVTWWQEQASVRIFTADDLAQFQRAVALAASCVAEARAILDAVDNPTTTRPDRAAPTEEAHDA
jgi:hypothetical protein